jgi:ribonuclease H-related protein
MTKKYYAYIVPSKREISGITESWAECEKLVSGKPGAKYRGFKTLAEAKAWLIAGADYGFKKKMPKGIYFDAGTGRGVGVEINVADEKGAKLLFRIKPKSNMRRNGEHWVVKNESNNYGELLACYYALGIAIKKKIKKVFGDSQLVLNYWSKGYVKEDKVSDATVRLVKLVKKLRVKFENSGGELEYISGDDNPADLGFHRR